MKFFVVDDDPSTVAFIATLLRDQGHEVITAETGEGAIDAIVEARPDCALLDLMMPGTDGLTLCRDLRARPELRGMTIVVISGKSYEFDRNRAFKMGADGFITKPLDPETFGDKLDRVLADHVDLTFWGVRGTLPVPGPDSLRYGGNTNCVTLEFAKGPMLIFDAGTGIKALADHLLASERLPLEAKVFISHPHWDHINALPFFAPLYIPGSEFAIYGARQGDLSVRETISAQMDGVYFPITIKEFASRVYFVDLMEQTLDLGNGITVTTKLLSHPGHCLGYRIDYRGRSICYVTDNELYPRDHRHFNPHYEERLAAFVADADALITDVTYTDAEYRSKIGWGHSSVGRVADLAAMAKVKTLFLYHHDPDQTDADIDAKLAAMRAALAERQAETVVEAPAEKQTFRL